MNTYSPGFFETPFARRLRERATHGDAPVENEFALLLAYVERTNTDFLFMEKYLQKMDLMRPTPTGCQIISASNNRHYNVECAHDEYGQFVVTDYVDADGVQLEAGSALQIAQPHAS